MGCLCHACSQCPRSRRLLLCLGLPGQLESCPAGKGGQFIGPFYWKLWVSAEQTGLSLIFPHSSVSQLHPPCAWMSIPLCMHSAASS